MSCAGYRARLRLDRRSAIHRVGVKFVTTTSLIPRKRYVIVCIDIFASLRPYMAGYRRPQVRGDGNAIHRVGAKFAVEASRERYTVRRCDISCLACLISLSLGLRRQHVRYRFAVTGRQSVVSAQKRSRASAPSSTSQYPDDRVRRAHCKLGFGEACPA